VGDSCCRETQELASRAHEKTAELSDTAVTVSGEDCDAGEIKWIKASIRSLHLFCDGANGQLLGYPFCDDHTAAKHGFG
jgi:hypothetical protein